MQKKINWSIGAQNAMHSLPNLDATHRICFTKPGFTKIQLFTTDLIRLAGNQKRSRDKIFAGWKTIALSRVITIYFYANSRKSEIEDHSRGTYLGLECESLVH